MRRSELGDHHVDAVLLAEVEGVAAQLRDRADPLGDEGRVGRSVDDQPVTLAVRHYQGRSIR